MIQPKYLLIILCFFITPSCQGGGCEDLNKQSCEVLKDFTVAGQNNALRFDHTCSDLDNHNGHYQSAYAFFEKADSSKAYKALSLAEVGVGWMGYHPSAQASSSGTEGANSSAKGIFLDLTRLQIESFEEWAGQSFSIALQVRNNRTNQTATGKFSKTFSYSYQGGGYPENKPYILSDIGNLFWEQLKEPEEDKQTETDSCISCENESENQRRNEFKVSSAIDISSSKIAHPEDPHSLFLILRNESAGATILLQGPVVLNLKQVWSIEYSGPRVLTWEVLNPWQEGGLWDWISDSFQYGDCIYLRKQAKKEFSQRFVNQ